MTSQLVKYTMAQRDDDSVWDAGQVIPGLWVGGLSAAEDAKELAAHGVVAVLTVAARLRPALPEGIAHTYISLDDHPCADLLAALPRALEALDAVLGDGEAKTSGSGERAILVHCASGVSRSVSACIAWLMTRRGLSLDDALRQVREGRPNGSPNHGFMQALQLLEKSGGNIAAAAKQWSQVGAADRMEKVNGLRDAANALHARADELEERLAQQRSSAGAPSKELLAELGALQSEVDSASPQDGFDDRVAQMIRKTAAQKIKRLLAQWEEGEPSKKET